MASFIKNVLIGIFVLAAIGIITFMLLFLHPSVGDNAKTLQVLFTDIDKVNIGTRVTFAGKPVGEVVSIEELASARTERLSLRGKIYVFKLILKVDSGVDVFNGDMIILRTSGLLGERNIEITPLPLQPGQKLEKVEDQILFAAETTNLEDAMKEIEKLTGKFDTVLDDVHRLMQQVEEKEIITKIAKTIDNIKEITESLNQPEKWSGSLDNIVSLIDRAHKSWGAVDTTLINLQESSENILGFTQKANAIIDHTAKGEGTIGKLFMGDEVYLRLKSILGRGEGIMNDIHSYGLLFHLDKRWQRLQTKRLHLMEKLGNPDAFSRYFNEEINSISDSLSRVSLVLHESECYPIPLINNAQFTGSFSKLLRRVETMEETLKLINEQMVDQQTCTAD